MSQQQIDDLINRLAKQSMKYTDFVREFEMIEELNFIDFDLNLVELLGLGVNLNAKNELNLRSKSTKIKDEIFCVVDIETTGAVRSGQIIELGAVKIKNGKEIATFESFVKAADVPFNITQLTGIDADMLKNAPSLASVLNEFRLFLASHIFVAHNVGFDYNFISQSLQKQGFGLLLNQKLCTINLSRRIITSDRYNLGTLKELLGIQSPQHRALSDARAAAQILNFCIKKLPFYIKSTHDLINFSKADLRKIHKK